MLRQKPKTQAELNVELMEDLAQFYWNPLGYVMFNFPWDTNPEIQICELEGEWADRFPNAEFGPDVWACEFLDELGAEIFDRKFDGRHAISMPIRFATSSGHGIGKSAMTSWIIKFIMDTRPFSKGIVTASTQDQLKTKTWAELGKWNRMSLTGHLFDYTAGRGSMTMKNKQYPSDWRCDAQTSKEENSESFAGLHAANSTPFYIFDEASGIPDKIFEVREGGLTDGEAMCFDFGNPTQNSGVFFENCEGKFRHRYNVRRIDSRDVKITNKNLFKEWAKDWGEDSDFYKVRVKGEFPDRGSLEFIARSDVEAAGKRELPPPNNVDPLVIGVDVARFGDDSSVIRPRIGMDARSWPARRYKGLDTVQLTGRVIECVRDFKELGIPCAAIFVDGGGVGGGVVDQLRALGYPVIEVQFGNRASDTGTYRYVMDEIWGKMRAATKTRLCIPTRHVDPALCDQMTSRQYDYNLKHQIALESKKDMKARGIESPDDADGLAITFYQEVSPVELADGGDNKLFTKHEYDPLQEKVT